LIICHAVGPFESLFNWSKIFFSILTVSGIIKFEPGNLVPSCSATAVIILSMRSKKELPCVFGSRII